MRALAIKYSDLGDHKKAMDYISRVETLSQTVLPTQEHHRNLEIMLAKVDILLKKHSLGTEEDYLLPIAIAKEAYELSKRIFGEKAF